MLYEIVWLCTGLIIGLIAMRRRMILKPVLPVVQPVIVADIPLKQPVIVADIPLKQPRISFIKRRNNKETHAA
jgi:hypothetical protein